jgi:hypothetical protein
LGKQTDTNPDDNSQSLTVNVTGKQGADVAAVGATASGAAVTLPVGIRNNGPATLDLPAGSAVGIDVNFPAGTKVATKPDGCYEQTWPQTHYTCYSSDFAPFLAKTTLTWKFQVEITKVIARRRRTRFEA